MSVEKLKGNISEINNLIKQLKVLQKNISYSDSEERKMYSRSYNSILAQIKLLNNAIPFILNEISGIKKLDGSQKTNLKTESFSFVSTDNKKSYVTLSKEDQKRFVKELSLSQSEIARSNNLLNKDILRKPSKLAIVSNKFFGRLTDRISKTAFADLKKDLRESNSRFLLSTYLSICFFISFSILFLGLILLILINLVISSALLFIWVPFVLFFLSLLFFYLFPSTQKSSINGKINQEIPFATIYMAAIAGSNIEPTKIFKIIANNPEYKYFGFEIRKVINQVELYGYDLVNALRNVAKNSMNEKLADLLNGMATNIVSGGSLKNYLDKRAENLLVDYRLERERYNAVSATFMDIYISVLITAPLILVMMIVVMSVTGFNLGFAPNFLIYISVGLVALINILFLVFLQIKQPKS